MMMIQVSATEWVNRDTITRVSLLNNSRTLRIWHGTGHTTDVPTTAETCDMLGIDMPALKELPPKPKQPEAKKVKYGQAFDPNPLSEEPQRDAQPSPPPDSHTERLAAPEQREDSPSPSRRRTSSRKS